MVGTADTRWSSGQATLEHVGLVLVVALMFGALGTWAVRGFQPPDAPPPVIERVAAPLFGGLATGAPPVGGAPAGTAGGADARAAVAGAVNRGGGAVGSGSALPVGMRGMARAMERAADAMTGAAGDGAAGAPARGERSVVRRISDGVLWWGALNVDGQIEAGKGFLEQIGVRAEDLVKDPVKTVEGAIDRLSRPPVTSTADRVANIVRALSGVGDRPFRESFLGISRDLGGLGADWLIAKFARGAGEVLGKLLGG
jgi:hypothetical protein